MSALYGQGLPAARFYFCHHALRIILATPVVHADGVAALRGEARGRRSNSSPSSGDQKDPLHAQLIGRRAVAKVLPCFLLDR